MDYVHLPTKENYALMQSVDWPNWECGYALTPNAHGRYEIGHTINEPFHGGRLT